MYPAQARQPAPPLTRRRAMPTSLHRLCRILAACALILATGLAPAQATGTSPFARLKQTLQSVLYRIQHKQAEIHHTRVDKSAAEDKLAACQDQLETARDRVASCRERLVAA